MLGSTRTLRALALVGFALLVFLHADFWRPARDGVWFGWLPEELAWRLGWMGLAWLYLGFLCRTLWREPEDEAVLQVGPDSERAEGSESAP